MAYTKTKWAPRQGSGLNRFTKSQETAASVVLTPDPENVTAPGTPFTAENMNHIEEGIESAHEGIAAEAQARLDAINTEAQARQQGEATLTTVISNLTKDNVGLGNVTNDAQVKRSEMGTANGVPTLNSNGKVPLDQLPEFMSGEGDSEALARAKEYTDIQVLSESEARQAADQDLQDQMDTIGKQIDTIEIPTLSDSPPSSNTEFGSPGTANTVSRSDHSHPTSPIMAYLSIATGNRVDASGTVVLNRQTRQLTFSLDIEILPGKGGVGNPLVTLSDIPSTELLLLPQDKLLQSGYFINDAGYCEILLNKYNDNLRITIETTYPLGQFSQGFFALNTVINY
ncbi:MAG: hypothetical protein LBH43_19880 [Treponema sp.]|jgi:hypothetical protein|nr:hypothetical protein [Treponema sp.]